MTAIYDDDPARDAEQAVAAFFEHQREERAMQDAADTLLQEVREYLIAIATAHLIGEPDDGTQVIDALNEHVSQLLREDYPRGAQILTKALYDALWCGGRGVEREARMRLIQLRDANDIAALIGGDDRA